jgi:2-polyprenyl-3-methyl-5-hydroxy-6-metoxy-1,4-benzoquinol methylase
MPGVRRRSQPIVIEEAPSCDALADAVPPLPQDPDPSNGWEAVALDFIRERRLTQVGVAVVSAWASQLPPGCTILDLGCGPGVPRSDPLHRRGTVYAVDASPSLARAYQERYPAATVACEPAEASPLFGRQFDGVLSWGLVFLLPAIAQEAVIRRVANALKPGGRFLFTAPQQVGTWADNSTGRQSVSLGLAGYRELIADASLTLVREHDDEGENHYYDTISA